MCFTVRHNVVDDGLRRLSTGSVVHIKKENKELEKYFHKCACLGVGLKGTLYGGVTLYNLHW